MTAHKPSAAEIRPKDHVISADEKTDVELQSIAKRRKEALDALVALSEECGGYPELD